MHGQLMAQLIGFVALIVSLWVFQLNKRTTMLTAQLWGNLLFAIHFALLGAYTGAALNLVGAGRSYSFNKFRKKRWSGAIFWGFIGIFVAADIATWQGIISLLPLIGMISGAFAYWQPTAKSIRVLSLIAPPAWFIYNAVVSSYAGMATEVILMSSILIGMYRLDKQVKRVAVRANGV